MAIGKTYETIRVNVNLPVKLVERVKKFSEDFGIPATQGYILLLNSGLKTETMPNQLEMVNNIIENAKQQFKDNDNDTETLF